MILSTEEYIQRSATKVNNVSEKYQLIHATFAIEKLIENKRKESIQEEIAGIRERMDAVTDMDVLRSMSEQIRKIKTDPGSKIRIVVDYLSAIEADNARTIRSKNTFCICLPASMENVRNADGKIDFERMSRLRQLMAHELGHIVLHSGVLCPCETLSEEEKEREADFFADTLINLRKKRNGEIYSDEHFKDI